MSRTRTGCYPNSPVAPWHLHFAIVYFLLVFVPLAMLLFSGCGDGRSVLAAAPPEEPPAARLQKPEPDKPEPGVEKTNFNTTKDQFPQLADGQVALRICAQVNSVPILDEEVRNACFDRLASAGSDADKARLYHDTLEELIDQELLIQDLMDRVGKKRPQVLKKLREAFDKQFEQKLTSIKKGLSFKTEQEIDQFFRARGQSLESFRKQSERAFMANEYRNNRIWGPVDRISRDDIEKYYYEHASEFQTGDSVEWQDVFIPFDQHPSRDLAQQAAQQALAKAKNGTEFVKLAAEYPNAANAFNKGQGTGKKRGEIQPPDAEPILFQLKDGEVGPLIELGSGYHIVRLVQRTYAGVMPLNDKLQTEIRRKLQNIVAEQEKKRFVNDLRKRATIDIRD